MLAISRVSMTRPSVLLLDEPTASLAPKVAHELLVEHVVKLASLDVAVLLVEQRAIEALAVAAYAYVMVVGSIAVWDPPRS